MFATTSRAFSLLVTLTLTAHGVHGYSSGAPQGTCQEMVPRHGVPPQGGFPPFTITPSKLTYSPGETLTVSLQSTDGNPFIGLLLEARLGDTPVGSFTPPSGEMVQALQCGSGGALTHTPGLSKTSLIVTWTAPAQVSGPIRFRATFVRNKVTFWVGVESADIVVMGGIGATTTNSVVTGAVTNNAMSAIPSTSGMPRMNPNAAGNAGNHGNRLIYSITHLIVCLMLGMVLYHM